ncbi:hypothetical protein VFMJ11_A1013 [Aliivibrio fischeri MJ11]|uniref:Uncharacterized protein n=1 Tax=Aliivibrio fischeri (strain MJ11) TaxID=388396 RepID=B5EV43_ALIFM|nr:hypothetical protein VFMJ11_A1013 [Aliivibrio fischeri MJ11]
MSCGVSSAMHDNENRGSEISKSVFFIICSFYLSLMSQRTLLLLSKCAINIPVVEW